MPPGSLALVMVAYLLGTFPTARLIAGRHGRDPSREGSGNPGASNVYRILGRRAGALVMTGDLAKGAVPTAVGLAIGGRPLGTACLLAAVAGHVWPLWRPARGGKGVATASGGALVLHPLASLVLIAVFVAVVRARRVASLGSLAMAAGLPLLVAAGPRPGWEVAAAAGLSALVVLRHRGNLARLRGRREPTLPGGPEGRGGADSLPV